MLRVLTLSTLYPDDTRPNFGPFVELQTRALAAHPDVDLQVLAPRGIPPLIGRFHPKYRALAALPDRELRKGVPVSRPIFAHWPGRGASHDPRRLAQSLIETFATHFRTFPVDVIDAEFFWPDGPAAIALGQALGVPVSIKARGADIHFWGRDNGATRAQVVAAGQAADGLLAVSAALKADMVALGMPEKRITVHYTGIDRTRFYVRDRAAAKAALGVTGPLLVSVGNLIARKGHALVIEALRQVPDAQLVIIGAGEAHQAFVALAAKSGVTARVRFLGSQPHAVIADWLAAADAMVLMSTSEGLANAWVEALASGTPLVISDVGGAREVLDRPEAGVLADFNAGAVARAIRHVLARNPDRHAVAATVDRFSWDANTAALYAHLARLVRG
jgi:teichuronic acid biosynthesis glycosyltransferase TuaC